VLCLRSAVAASLQPRSAESWAHANRLIKHEAVPECGSYEVRFADGRPSRYFYFEDLAGLRVRPDQLTRDQALKAAQALARAERDKLKRG
jgi:hypothetical protein